MNSRFAIGSKLGSGASGEVFKGYDNELKRDCTIKILHHPSYEIEIGKHLEDTIEYTHSIRVPYYHEDDFIVFPYIEHTLVDIFPKLTGYEQQMMLFELGMALLVLQKWHVSHMDIKIYNILVLIEDRPRIYNFNNGRYVITSKYLPVIIDFSHSIDNASLNLYTHDWNRLGIIFYLNNINSDIMNGFNYLISNNIPPNSIEFSPFTFNL